MENTHPSYRLSQKADIGAYTDRELLELLLTSQVIQYRMLVRFEETLSLLRNGETDDKTHEAGGNQTPREDFRDLISKHEPVLKYIMEHLERER